MDQETLYKFFNSQATLEEEERIRIWVEENPDNERLFVEQRKLYDSMTLLKDENDLRSLLSREGNGYTPKRKYSLIREVMKIAAVAVIVFFAAYFLFQESDGDKHIAMQTISVPAGQRINITLPDGTNVWLNARTTIQYPVSFNNKERLVKLDGQAYFDVERNEDIPFIVETNVGKIRVLGTKFDVLDYSGSNCFETALMDGSVEVSLISNPKQKMHLSPDTKACLVNGKLQRESLIDYNSYRWKEGLISFENKPFADIMKEFEKSYGVKIVIQNNIVLAYSYTGKFRIVDGIDYALRVLQKDIKFTYSRDNDNNILYIK